MASNIDIQKKCEWKEVKKEYLTLDEVAQRCSQTETQSTDSTQG